MATAQDVQVKVAYGLSAVVARVDDGAVTVGQALLLSDLVGGGEEVAKEYRVVGCGLGQGLEVLLWNEQDVGRGLWIDVGKGEDVVVFVELGDGDGAGGDLAEETVGKSVERRHWSVEKTLSSGFLYTLSSRLYPLLYFFKYFGSMPGAHGS